MSHTTSLRERQAELTKEAILRALVELVQRGVRDFSVQAVADAAGVSHRTVYRHYPSREALLDALGDWLNERYARALGWDDPKRFRGLTAEELGRVAEVGYHLFDEHADVTSAYVVLSIGAGLRLAGRVKRTAIIERVLAERSAHLSSADAKAVAAIVRGLASSSMWHHTREHADVSRDASARAARWAIDTLVAALAAGGGPQPAGEQP